MKKDITESEKRALELELEGDVDPSRLRSIIAFLLDKVPVYGYVEYDPSFGDNRLCKCGHTYYRHFDSYDDMCPVGCKYCCCDHWVDPRSNSD